ncbi:hypothetical protein JCM8547_005483 [Rhodosporidiobolus lusitaniae]
MNTSAASAPQGDGMTLRERQARPSFYMSSSDEEDYRDDGAISDGDPPYMAGGAAPPAPAAPPAYLPAYPSGELERPSGPPSLDSGSSGTVKREKPSGPRRVFEELEDIIFSNPRSFITLAGQIADARGVQLVISDDRTHKVSSAYMHVTCSFRRSGCCFILKLTKAKEGGWIIKGAKSSDLDGKQRSQYRCRHPAGSRPDTSHGLTVADWLTKSTSHPEPGTRPKAAKSRTASVNGNGDGLGLPTIDAPAAPAPYASEPLAQVESLAGKAPRTQSIPGGRMGGEALPTDADRALAPPFQRSIDLQAQIVPALGPRSAPSPGSQNRNTPSVYYPAVATPGYPSPSAAAGPSPSTRGVPVSNGGTPYYDGSPYHPAAVAGPSRVYPPSGALTSLSSGGVPPGVYAPLVAVANPVALPEWTILLQKLGDNTLLPLAKVLASPAVGCTPAEFFAEDDKLQADLLAALPERATGLFAKLKLAKRMKEGGRKAWDEICAERKKEGEPNYVMGVRRNTLPASIPPQPLLPPSGSLPPATNGTTLANGHSVSPSPFPASSSAHPFNAMDVDPSTAAARPRSGGVAGQSSPGGATNPPPPPGAASGVKAE